MDDYVPKYEEFSFSSVVNDLLFIFEHGSPIAKARAVDCISHWREMVVEAVEQERKRKAEDTIQHRIDIKKRTMAAKAARKKRGLGNDSPFLTAISNLSEIKETIQRTKELTDQLRAEIYLVQSKLKNKNGK